MAKAARYYLLLLAVFIVAGCVSTQQGFSFTLTADPPRIFSLGAARVFMDLENKDVKPIDNVAITLFDKSILRGDVCAKQIPRLLPMQSSELRCVFTAPQLEQPLQGVTLHAKAEFDASLAAVQGIEMLTEEEYRRQAATGSLQQKAASYAYRDRNVELLVEFNEPLPVVIRPGKEYFMYMRIRNIGDGFVSNIRDSSIRIQQSGSAVQCEPFGTMEVVGREFPRITCRLALPAGVTYLTNYDILISVNYHYELRQSAQLTVIK